MTENRHARYIFRLRLSYLHRRSGTTQRILICQKKSKKKLTHWRSREALEPWSDTWLSSRNTTPSAYQAFNPKSSNETKLLHRLLVINLICQSWLPKIAFLYPTNWTEAKLCFATLANGTLLNNTTRGNWFLMGPLYYW